MQVSVFVKHFLLTCCLLLISIFAWGQCSISIGSSGTLICDNSVGIYATFSGSNFQWYKNGNLIPGATSSSMTLSSGQGGTYWLTANISSCSYPVMSNQITISDNSPVGSIYPSGNPYICKGYNVQLNATSAPGYTYQWTKNGSVINGATSTTLLASETGNYGCIVTNGICIKSFNPITVLVVDPVISPSLAPPLCTPGQTVTFSTEANPMYSAYQWRKDGVILDGATTPSYTAILPGSYTITVTYTNCQSTSNPRIINSTTAPTVNAGPDKSGTVSDVIILNGVGGHPACPVNYNWTKISGPGATMNGVNTSILSLSNLVGGGNYVYRLTAIVNSISAYDEVNVSVDSTPFQKDSLALVDLFQATGPNWSNKSGWLSGPLSSWYGITLENGRVSGINLADNGLVGNIPASFGNLTALKELDLGFNSIESLPEQFGNLINLESANFESNLLVALPQSIGNLKKLNFLALYDNLIESIPSGIGGLSNITLLDFGYNKITQIPGALGKLKKLGFLNLENNEISTIADSLKYAESLYHLVLNDNQITELSGSIFGLQKLDYLCLNFNKISSIPPVINQLTKLKEFYISYNSLASIPQELFALTNLEGLALDNNYIKEIPQSINQLNKLKSLYIGGNRLTTLPASLGSVSSLEYLSCSENRITDLPETLKNLANLRGADLFENKLEFNDLETVLSWPNFKKLTLTFSYAPQAPVYVFSAKAQRGLKVDTKGANNVYQWKKNGAIIAGATSPAYMLNSADFEANDGYECVISNPTVKGLILNTNKKHPKEENASVGDFITKASGNWNDYKIWKIFDGTEYQDADEGELPGQNNPVYLEMGHSITITEIAQCKDLHLNVAADLVRLDTKENVLDVYGKLRLYSALAPGINSTGSGIPGWIRTGTNGRIRLKGNSNRVITEKDEFSNNVNLNGWTLEVDFANDQVTGIINSLFRANAIIVTSGKVDIKSQSFKLGKL